MKFLKIFVCAALVITIAAASVSCTAENIIKGLTKGAVDIGPDGNVKIGGESGVVVGDAKWDKELMFDLSAPKANLTTYISSDGITMYYFDGMDNADAKKYVETIIDAGFSYNALYASDYNYVGTNSDGETITFMYDESNGSGMVYTGKGEKPSEEAKPAAIVGATDKKWDSKEMLGLPDPGAKVLTYSKISGAVYYYLEPLKDTGAYVKKLKDAGFTEDAAEYEIDGVVTYSAMNKEGDRISYSASKDGTYIDLTAHK